MRKTKFLSIICAAFLAIALFSSAPAVTAKAQNTDFDCAFSVSATGTADNCAHYGCKELITYSESEAAQAGLPQGYSGSVASVVSNAINRGVTLDFSSRKIPTALVESITFRVYIGDDGKPTDGYPELRIPMPGLSGAWAMRYSFADKTDQWVDVLLKNGNGSFFENNGDRGFSTLSLDGYLHKFELSMRHNGSVGIFYIDSITVGFVDDGDVPPELIYNGKDVVTIAQGQTLAFDVSAIDALEGEVDVEYVWGDPTALDGKGNPKIGTHTLTFKASDYFGNTSQKTITVIVEEPDITPPVIEIPTNTIYAKIGATPLLNVQATDDKTENVQVTQVWSEGALDGRGKLTEGTHTLTFTACDLSNNVTEKVVTFIVSKEGDTADIIIDEEALCPDVEEPEESGLESAEPEESSSSEVIEPEESSSSEVIEPEESSSSEVIEPEESSSITPSQSTENESSKDAPLTTSSAEQESLENTKKSGCSGAINSAMVVTLSILFGAVVLKKKKD